MSPAPFAGRLARVGVVSVLLLAPLLPGLVPSAAGQAPPATGSTLTVAGPDGLSLTVTPDPTAGVMQGDVLEMTFSGMQENDQVIQLGMCPTAAPEGSTVTVDVSCGGRWPTGLPGALNADTGDTPALSTTQPSFAPYAKTDGTLTIKFIVGAGTVNPPGARFRNADGTSTADDGVVCDAANPCSIGFKIAPNRVATTWSSLADIVVRPELAESTSSTGCAAAGAGSLAVAGPERAQDEVAAWNSGLCAESDVPLPMNLVGQGEPDGLRSLGGTSDLTFAGSGLLGSSASPAATEPRVLTPVGLNAVVLAQIGGVETPSNTPNPASAEGLPYSSGSPDPLPSIALSQSDVAKILVHDYPTAAPPSSGPVDAPAVFDSIMSHAPNAALREVFTANEQIQRGAALPFNLAPTTVYPVGADSTPVVLSDLLNSDPAVAQDLTLPALPNNLADGTAGTTVGAFTDFSSVVDAAGAYTRQTSSASGIYTSIFGKDIPGPAAVPCPSLDPFEPADRHSCGRFVVTDLVTARSLDLPVASIQNATGAFVAPDAAGLQAAAAAGTTDDTGLFTPDLAAGGGAYPMTFVEYAVSQASPLLDESCAPRTAAQNSLNEVATYLANGGQSALADGLAPLTAPLVEQARASVARIGASSTTSGPCAPVRAADILAASGGASSASGLGGGSGAFAAAGGASALSNPAGLSGPVDAAAVQVPTAETTAAVEQAAATVDIPVFGQAGALGALGPLAGLVGLVGLTSGAGVLASNRLSGKSFADLRSWVHHTFVGDPEIQTVEQR